MSLAKFYAIATLLAAAIAAAGWFGMNALAAHYRAEGRAEVQARWGAAVLAQQRDAAAAAAAQQAAARAREQTAQKEAEAHAIEAARREADLRSHAADLDRGLDGLRRELAATDAAFANYRAARPDAAARAGPDAAAAGARELFGQCADRYAGMAKSAANLSAQVIGLQAHVLVIQPEAKRLMEPAE